MKLFLLVKSRKALPTTFDLARIMWEEGISLSRWGDAIDLKNCTTLGLSWAKWEDDKRWREHQKSNEMIYFELPKKVKGNPITIEIADDAPLVDKRAAYKAAIYIAEKAEGKISEDGKEWLTPDKYSELVDDYLKYTFKEAAELSF